MASLPPAGSSAPPHFHFFTPGVPKKLDRLQAFGLFPDRLSFAAQTHPLLKAVNPTPPRFANGQMTLDEPGLYVGEAEGAQTLFIGIPASDYDRAHLAFRLISNLTTGHEIMNDKLYHDDGSLLIKLITQLEPIDVSCGGAAHLLNFLFIHLGVLSRSIYWTSLDKTAAHNRYHIANEVYLRESNSWLYLDAHWGLFFDAGYSALAFRDDPWERQKTFLRDQIRKAIIPLSWPENFDPTQRHMLFHNRLGLLIGMEREPTTDEALLRAQTHTQEPIHLMPPDVFLRYAMYEGTTYRLIAPREKKFDA